VLQPVGGRPPHVYWVRRIGLLVLVIVLVLLGSHACGAGADDGSARPQTDQSRPTVTATPSTSTSPGGATAVAASVPCRPTALRISVTSDATSYSRGVRPRFTAVVRNTGPACRFPTALASRTWRILSGTDEVWSTADCPRSPDGKRVRLKAGGQVTYVLPWDRFRSTSGCAVAGAPAQAGTYRLYVTIAGASAAPAVFHLAD